MLYLDEPNITHHEIQSVVKALEQGQISTRDQLVSDFEKRMEDYLGVPCCATNSGTAALHLALMECGVGRGDEVILPVLSFIATANVVKYVGAKSVFVDVDLDTWNANLRSTDNLINDKVAAFIPIDLYGNPHESCFSLEIKIIVDSCESLGSMGYKNERIAGEGYYGYNCFSFNRNKTVTTGSGGLVVAWNVDGIKQRQFPALYDGIGYNYRMTALHAAVGLAQMDRLEELLSIKRNINSIYRNELDGKVTFQQETEHAKSNWWMTACLFPESIDIPDLQKALESLGVPTRRIFRPLNQHPAYRDGKDYPNAQYIYEHGLCLPSSTLNSDDSIYQACKAIKEFL